MVGVVRVEGRTRHKGHALFDGAFGEFTAIGHLAARTREAGPDKQTTLGLHEFNRVAQFAAQRIAHGHRALGIDRAHLGQGRGHAAGLEVLRRGGLGEGAGVGVAELLAHGGLGQQFGRADHPAHAQAGAQHLGQRAAVHQALAAAGHAGAQGQQAGRRRVAEVQVAVRVVFHHQHVVLHRQFQHPLAALQAEHGAAGVAEGGNQVDELGLVFDDEFLESVGVHALPVHRCRHELGAVQAEALDGGQEGRAFDDHLVAGGNEGLAQQIQRLLAAGGDDQVLGRHALVALAGHESGELFAQRVVALGRAVLQGAPGFFGQRSIDGFADAVHIEHGAVGKAPGKADDAGPAQQLEEFADGGGFDVVQAVGKRNGKAHANVSEEEWKGGEMVAPCPELHCAT